MEKLLPKEHLMLASVKRVKALILEEIALDSVPNDPGMISILTVSFVITCMGKWLCAPMEYWLKGVWAAQREAVIKSSSSDVVCRPSHFDFSLNMKQIPWNSVFLCYICLHTETSNLAWVIICNAVMLFSME